LNFVYTINVMCSDSFRQHAIDQERLRWVFTIKILQVECLCYLHKHHGLLSLLEGNFQVILCNDNK